MVSLKGVQFLFGTVLVLFIITLISHVSTPPPHDPLERAQMQTTSYSSSFTSKFANKLKPYFGDTESLGTISEHLKRSEGNYQDLIQQRAVLMKDYPKPSDKPLFPCNSHDAYWKTPFSIWDFVPASFNCPHSIIRIGRLGDGGKWLCGLEKHLDLPKSRKSSVTDLSLTPAASIPVGGKGEVGEIGRQPGCIIYSFGIQIESSFEDELLKRTPNCQIWGYDFSVTKFGPQLHEIEAAGRAHFTQAGIAGTTDTERNPAFYSIQDLMAMNGHDHIDILKMDIEGYEFESMNSLIKHFTSQGLEIPISQFLVEIHLDPGRIGTDDFLTWWELLENAGFRPVWTEPNLLVTTIPLFDGMPRYAEYTFINIKDTRSPLLK